MSCNKQWETASGATMPMHEMSDQHVINAYRRLEEMISEAQAHDPPYWAEEGEFYDPREDFEFSLADLESEAERRWGPGHGEALIRDRLKKGVSNVPLTPPVLGKRKA